MFKHYFELIENVAIYPIISLLIFFSFFVGLFVYVWLLRKSHIDMLKNLPLEDGTVLVERNHTSLKL